MSAPTKQEILEETAHNLGMTKAELVDFCLTILTDETVFQDVLEECWYNRALWDVTYKGVN
jgi:hypothetical protein